MKRLIFLLPFLLPAMQAPAQYVKENLGAMVNSQYNELTPRISPDGKKLFFIREDDPANTLYPQPGTQDIWMSKLDSSGNWTKAKHLGRPFNLDNYNGLIGFSTDGNTRYMKGYYKDGHYDGMGFSYCEMTDKGWGEPQGFKVKGYESKSKSSETVSNYLHSDNRILLMSFDPGGKRNYGHDIYVSFRKENFSFTEPMRLSFCTSEYDEMSPFLASDGVTLYFSSNRPGGYGSNDIWMTRRLDDTWQTWSEPVNLGSEINTSDWDGYYSIAASGDVAYMVSYAKGGLGGSDIVRIKLKEEVRPNPVALVSGKVLDQKTGKPLAATITYYTMNDNVEVGTAHSSPGTGEYQIILPYGKTYGFRAQSDGYYAVSQNMDLSGLKAYEEVKRDLYLVPIEVGQVVRLNNIFFEFGKATLQPESAEELDRVVKLLSDNPTMEIDIAGHTDNVGSDESNRQLSGDRAKAVYDYLVSKGIAANRLSFKGFGESKPLTTNDTEEGRAQNRRVEFTIRKR